MTLCNLNAVESGIHTIVDNSDSESVNGDKNIERIDVSSFYCN